MRQRLDKATDKTNRFKVGDKIFDIYWMEDAEFDKPHFRAYQVVGVGDTFTTIATVSKDGRVNKHVSKILTVHAARHYSKSKLELMDRLIEDLQREIDMAKSKINFNTGRIFRIKEIIHSRMWQAIRES